jgi:sulfoxide reductase catalytic subunit YedY
MMSIRRKRGWELPERAAIPEDVYLDRRRLLRALGVGGAVLAAPLAVRMGMSGDRAAPAPQMASPAPDPSSGLYPVARAARYVLDRPLTEEDCVTSYNNFYEFGSHKQIAQAAQALPIRPWQVVLDGLVELSLTLDIDDLLRRMPLEERLYGIAASRRGRWRCRGAAFRSPPWSTSRARSAAPDTCE